MTNDLDLVKCSFLAMKIIESFEKMNDSIAVFCDLLQTNSVKIEVPSQKEFFGEICQTSSDLERAIVAYKDIWFHANEDGRSTRVFQGVVFGDDELIRQAKLVNQLKDEFHSNVIKLNKLSAKEKREISSEIKKSSRTSLSRLGLGRLCLKHCYRHISIFEIAPRKINYCWYANGKSIKKISAKSAEERLLSIENNASIHIQIQLNAVRSLSPTYELAIVQSLAPHIKANFIFIDLNSNNKIIRKTSTPALPIVILQQKKHIETLVNFTLEPSPEKRTRKTRSDKLLDDDVFLPSIRAFKYKK